MAVVNKGRLLDVVVTAMAARANLASKPTVERIVRQAQANAIESFESHPVTQEIEEGPKSEGSALLGGTKGNLFSFIGFNSRTKPLIGLRMLLSQVRLEGGRAKQRTRTKSGIVNLTYNVFIPSAEDFEKEAAKKTPNRIGMRSRIHGVENGFDTLHYYLFRKKGFPARAGSQSGTGLQVKNIVSAANFNSMKYTTEISAYLIAMLSGVKIQGKTGRGGGVRVRNNSGIFAANLK